MYTKLTLFQNNISITIDLVMLVNISYFSEEYIKMTEEMKVNKLPASALAKFNKTDDVKVTPV